MENHSFNEITGKQFGDWTVLAFSHKNSSYSKFYICRCVCGTEKPISKSELISNRAKCCRSCANALRRKYKPIKIGDKFKDWTVLTFIEENNKYVMALCKCGNKKEVLKTSLLYGQSTKCASCRGRDGNIKHGHSCKGKTSPEYRAWCNMKNRCLNRKIKSFSNYGGRGIKIYQPWIDSFDNFLKDIGIKPSNKHSLERIDVNGDYKPGNVIWALQVQQTLNKRTLYKHKGNKISLRALSKQLNVQPRTVKTLLFKANFSIDDIAVYATLGHFQKTQMGISISKKTPYKIKELLKMKNPQPSKRHPLWYTWHSMKQRCLNQRNKDYTNYGSRGIKVDKGLETFDGFLNIIKNHLGPKPSIYSQLDRINPKGNYEKNNLRWATSQEQAINKINSLKINNKSISAIQLSKKYNINKDSIILLVKNGWNEKGFKFYSKLTFKEKKKIGILINKLTQNDAFKKHQSQCL